MKLGLLGHAIQYSLSPQLHRFWMDKLGLIGEYDLIDVDRASISRIFDDYQGFNVTTPYKKDVLNYLDELTPKAQQVGAVNTVFKSENQRWIGDNTDVIALTELLDVSMKRGLVLGSGGASLAAIQALNDIGAEVIVCSRQPIEENWISWFDRHQILTDIEVIINATPLGLYGIGCPLDFLPDHQVTVIDLIYQPVESPLLKMAQSGGHQIRDGFDVLIRQARHSFDRWWGVLPTLDGMRERLG